MAPITRSMKRRHEESRQEALNQSGRFNLKGLNQDIQLHILKSMEETDIETLISISKPLKHLFEKYEHEFPPPAALANREVITFVSSADVKRGRLRLQYNWNDRRVESYLKNFSFSKLRRYLQTAGEIQIYLHDRLPKYFRRGTVAYAELKAYIRRHCDIEVAFFLCKKVEHSAENFANLFSERTELRIRMTSDLWQLQPAVLFERHINAAKIEGVTSKNLALDMMRLKTIDRIMMNCEEPIELDEFIQEWRRRERPNFCYVIAFPIAMQHNYTHISFTPISNPTPDETLYLTEDIEENQTRIILTTRDKLHY